MRGVRVASSLALVVAAMVLSISVLPAVSVTASASRALGAPLPWSEPAGASPSQGLRSWSDYRAQDQRRLALARKVTDRLAVQVAWLQDRQLAAGVSAANLASLRDQVGRDAGLGAAVFNLDALGEINSELIGVARASAQVSISDLRNLLADSRRIGVDEAVLTAPTLEADKVESSIAGVDDPTALWPLIEPLAAQAAEVSRKKAEREADLSVQAEAAQQARDYYNSLAGLRSRGYDAVAQGRNEAAWAAFLGRGLPGDALGRLEAAAPALESNDRPALEGAVRQVQDLAAAVHAQFVTRLPHKVILVSLAAEHMWAYEDGGLVIDTLVTTGRPELPTDVGLMRVYRKNLNWLMHSPWGPGSPYWYPDLTVKYAMWFHPSGEAIHDSWWRGWYGPGSNLGGYGSHGCIGLPYGPIDSLYAWAPVDTPVVVIPGDGSSVSAQLARRTYNDGLMARLYGV